MSDETPQPETPASPPRPPVTEVTVDPGAHNRDMAASRTRLLVGGTYEDCSTMIVTPTRGVIPVEVLQGWEHLDWPPNQVHHRLYVKGLSVAEAYEEAFDQVVRDKFRWQYILTLEEDNIVPMDAFLLLLQSIRRRPTGPDGQPIPGAPPLFDVVSGLYWTKGSGGYPMIFGNPDDDSVGWWPVLPPIDSYLRPVRFVPFGCTLFRVDLFRRLARPWFREGVKPSDDASAAHVTQDAYFCAKAGQQGARFAVDTRVAVGHLDVASGKVW